MREANWTPSEIERREQCELGLAVVGNLGTDRALKAWAQDTGRYVYVGRLHWFGPTRWGNPFTMPKPEQDGDRDRICDLHAAWIVGQPLMQMVHTLRGKVLFCHCHPARCHGHTLAQLANDGVLHD